MSSFAVIFYVLIFGAISVVNFIFWLRFMAYQQELKNLSWTATGMFWQYQSDFPTRLQR